jgi:hypothetical protein
LFSLPWQEFSVVSLHVLLFLLLLVPRTAMVSSRFVCMADKKEDVYYDYLTILIGLTSDTTNIKWRLDSSATTE